MTERTLDMAVWDSSARRGFFLKEQLDMFANGGCETTLYTENYGGGSFHDVFFLSFDGCGEPVLRIARTVRENGETTFLMLVTDRKTDLTACFKPKIRPSGVLFRPVRNAELRDTLMEIADELDRLTQSESDDVFVFKSEGAAHRVPFRDILFFEAQNKKVVLHTKGQEIGYYDSIDSLSKLLPAYFVRCHRGFLVNARKIESMRGADMEMSLIGGVSIPFSRSCRDAVKNAISGKRGGAGTEE